MCFCALYVIHVLLASINPDNINFSSINLIVVMHLDCKAETSES